MPCKQTFVAHALDLLQLLGPVQSRSMFGGHGLYLRGLMFGLLDDDELFLKTDEATKPRFLEEGCAMWVYPGAADTSYYRPPDDAHEDAEAMLPWGQLAVEAALRKHAAKLEKEKAAAARRRVREAGAAAKAPEARARRAAKPAARAKAKRGRTR